MKDEADHLTIDWINQACLNAGHTEVSMTKEQLTLIIKNCDTPPYVIAKKVGIPAGLLCMYMDGSKPIPASMGQLIRNEVDKLNL